MAKNNKSSHPTISGKEKTTICEFYDLYYQGHTVVARNIHLGWEPIARLGSELVRSLGCSIGTHLYPTPEGLQGFGVHWDDHDIFALQLEGEKEWCLYDKGPALPRYSSSSREYRKHIIDDPGEPVQVITLRAGDLLYFPRGTIHRARAQTQSSLHLTYGLYPETWEGAIIEAIRSLARRSPALRKALPGGFTSGAADMDALQAQLEELVPRVMDDLDLAEAYERLAAGVVGRVTALPDGHFAQLAEANEIDTDTVMERRPGMITALAGSGDQSVLHHPGGTHEVPGAQATALRFIHEHERFRAGDLPCSAAAGLALVRALVGKGVLRRARSLGDQHPLP